MSEQSDNSGRESRTCRYGHGALKDGPGLWALQGVEHGDPTLADGVPWLKDVNRYFSAQVLYCPRCGYVELFDPDSVEQ